jgi:endo-1,4-beta-mannosidase
VDDTLLVPGAGIYNETAFRGLDFVLDQASEYGVKVMFTLTNNWKTFDSKYNVCWRSLDSCLLLADPLCPFRAIRTLVV